MTPTLRSRYGLRPPRIMRDGALYRRRRALNRVAAGAREPHALQDASAPETGETWHDGTTQ